MKNPPCARFGIRIRPKISEKPDESRNSSPPKATLLSVWMIQNCHCMTSQLLLRALLSPGGEGGTQCLAAALGAVHAATNIWPEPILARWTEVSHVRIRLRPRLMH